MRLFSRAFIEPVARAGCRTFIVHARIAVLKGLSPKENRSIPPLNYPRVYALKRDRPELEIVLNGGIVSVDECRAHLRHVDGVMIGRQAYHHPWVLAELEQALGNAGPVSRHDIVTHMIAYAERELESGAQLKHISAPHARIVCRSTRRARLASSSQRARASTRCGRRGVAGGARTVARCGLSSGSAENWIAPNRRADERGAFLLGSGGTGPLQFACTFYPLGLVPGAKTYGTQRRRGDRG